MVFIILCIVGVLVFFRLPIYGKIIVAIVNIFMPDPLPFVDEVFMIGMILADLKNRKNN
ncbi:MAG: hypothetical protein ACRC0W_02425 [Cetobacterium sp.]